MLGGKAFGRAFDPAEITGDDGGAVKFELRYRDRTGLAFLPRYLLYAFYDMGAVWNFNAGTEPTRRALASAGLGVSLVFRYGFKARLEVAQPLLRRVEERGTEGRDPRFFFFLSARF